MHSLLQKTSLIFLLTLLVCTSALGAEVRLFDAAGNPAANYVELLQNLQPGDTVLFSNNAVTIGNRLDNIKGDTGAYTAVFDIAGDSNSVLKIPKTVEAPSFSGQATPIVALDSFIDGYNTYKATGLNVTEIKNAHKGQFAIAQKVQFHQTFEDFIQQATYTNQIADFELKLQKLEELSYKTGLYGRGITVGDAHAGNFAWDTNQKDWVLFDWAASKNIAADGKLAYSPELMTDPAQVRKSLMYRNFSESIPLPINEAPGAWALERIETTIINGIAAKATDVHATILEVRPDFMSLPLAEQKTVMKTYMDQPKYNNKVGIGAAVAYDMYGAKVQGTRLGSFLRDLGTAGIFAGLGVGLDMAQGDDFKTALINQFFPSNMNQLSDYIGTPTTWVYTLDGMITSAPTLLNGASSTLNMTSAFFRMPPSAVQAVDGVLKGSANFLSSNGSIARASNILRAAQVPLMAVQWGVLVGQSTYSAMTDPRMPSVVEDFRVAHHHNYSAEMMAGLSDMNLYMKNNGTSEHSKNAYLGLLRDKMRSDFTDSVISLYQEQPTELNAVFLLLAKRVAADPSVRSEDLPIVVERVQRKYLEYHNVDLKKSGDISYALFQLGGPTNGGDTATFDMALRAAKLELDLVDTVLGPSGGASDLEKAVGTGFTVADEFRSIDTTQELEAFKQKYPSLQFDESGMRKYIAAKEYQASRSSASTSSAQGAYDEDLIYLAPFHVNETRGTFERILLSALGGIKDVLSEIKDFIGSFFKTIGNWLGLNSGENGSSYDGGASGPPPPYLDPENIDMQAAELNNEAMALEMQAMDLYYMYSDCMAFCQQYTSQCQPDRGDGPDERCGPFLIQREESIQQAYALRAQAESLFHTQELGGVASLSSTLNSTQKSWADAANEDAAYGQVIGVVDNVSGSGVISGWACAKYIPVSTKIKVLVGNENALAVEAYANTANEPAVSDECRSISNLHRFSVQIPENILSQYAGQPVKVVATSMTDGSSAQLANVFNLSGGSNNGGGAMTMGTTRLIAAHSGLCMDVSGVSYDNMAYIHQWDCHGGGNQNWIVSREGNVYTLVAEHSGKCLDISTQYNQNGDTFVQYDCYNGPNQKFYIEPYNSGYRLISVNTGKCMDVSGVSYESGAYIHQWDCHGGDNQTFYLDINP